MKKNLFLTIVLTTLFVFAASTLSFAGNWILSSKTDKLPADLEALVAKAGGTLVKSMDEVGIATAEFATREEAEAMEAYGFKVMPDIELQWIDQSYIPSAQVEHIGINEPYYWMQWHLPVIEAQKAWDLGVTGVGARVAIVDSGIWYIHPDLVNNVDLASSASFVAGNPSFVDQAGHGTHVAGIVAAADNSFGTIGVAPNATLIAVRVLGANGSGSASAIVAGIRHAVNVQADVINLSLGSYLKKSGVKGSYTAKDASEYVNMYRKVLNWANAQGVLVVLSAGNDSRDLQHDGNFIKLPAEASNGITVAATGPTAQQNFDNVASYTNYGANAIWVAAPGGDFLNAPAPRWYYDMVLSTSIGGWSFMAGTSMATPVVSGVAALIISKYGKMSPGEIKNIIGNTADDLGKPGRDEYYGKGRVNAYKAVK